MAHPVPPIGEQIDRKDANREQYRPREIEARKQARRHRAYPVHGTEEPAAHDEVGDQHNESEHAEVAQNMSAPSRRTDEGNARRAAFPQQEKEKPPNRVPKYAPRNSASTGSDSGSTQMQPDRPTPC